MSTQAPPQGQQETEVVTGQVMHIITKGADKWQIAVQPEGSQYTKNLWTKDYGLVQQMEQSIHQWFSFICGPSYWTNQQGAQVRSLWINGLTAPGQAQQGQQPQQQYQPQQQQQNQQPQQVQGQPGISPLEKEERIMREAAMKVVAHMLPHMRPEERNAAGMINVAEGLVAYFKLGPPPNRQPQDGNPGPVEEETPPAPDSRPEYSDDIPWPS